MFLKLVYYQVITVVNFVEDENPTICIDMYKFTYNLLNVQMAYIIALQQIR